jgi:hypothetical protein
LIIASVVPAAPAARRGECHTLEIHFPKKSRGGDPDYTKNTHIHFKNFWWYLWATGDRAETPQGEDHGLRRGTLHPQGLAPFLSSGEKVILQLLLGLGQESEVILIALNRDRTTILDGGPQTRTPSFNVANSTISVDTRY